MAGQDKQKRKDAVRVVDDHDVSSEEVVRLDAPKQGRMEKKGRIAPDALLASTPEKKAEKEEAPRPFDPEGEWLEELEAKDEKTVPMGWFVLLGAILLGIFGWVVFQSTSESPEQSAKEPAGNSQSGNGAPLGIEAENRAQGNAAAHFKETEELIKGFLGAESIDEQLKYVRHPERVRPLMEKFYQSNELVAQKFSRILLYRVFSLLNYPFIALSVEVDDGSEIAILIEDSAEGQLVDWESFVCYQEIGIEDYIASRPSRSVVLRAYVEEDYFHTFDFESKEKFASYKLKFRNSEEVMNGFVERGTELEQKFRKVYPKRGRRKVEPLILKVRFLEGGRSPRSVLIEELLSIKWAHAENPAEVASPAETQ